MLLNIAAHNVGTRNVKVSKRERHPDVYVLKTLRFGTLTLCAATFCNITLRHVTFTLCCFTGYVATSA